MNETFRMRIIEHLVNTIERMNIGELEVIANFFNIQDTSDTQVIEEIVKLDMESKKAPMEILEKITQIPVEAPPEKQLLLATILEMGYQLKHDVDIDTLRDLVANLKAEADVKVPATAEEEGEFDYTKVTVVPTKEDTMDINKEISSLILKVGGVLNEDSKRLVVNWQDLYTPGQIYQCLQRSFKQGACTLKHTNGLLKTTFPPEPVEDDNSNGIPKRIGKFSMSKD